MPGCRRCPTFWHLRLAQVDPDRNRRRHWSVSREPALFHPEGALVYRWGRMGDWTRATTPNPLPLAAAVCEARARAAAKCRKGYVVVECSWPGLLAEEEPDGGRS